MLIEIVGIKDVSFSNKETGERVEGQSVYFEYEDDRTQGVATDKVFLSSRKELVPVPSLPCSANLYFNKFGKVDSISLN